MISTFVEVVVKGLQTFLEIVLGVEGHLGQRLLYPFLSLVLQIDLDYLSLSLDELVFAGRFESIMTASFCCSNFFKLVISLDSSSISFGDRPLAYKLLSD